ncbi:MULTISPECIES: integrase arm-type DNA-binding domain-containing protein [Glaesserella]|uniref:tyrosine-type recombinase/integrase n=1 Tax=Glaesserella TaxID=2094023 RepID=UPI001EDF5231|nr:MULTISPECIES: integrase arm-type DNA-binding domain-containing protein [Glaesserella]
MPKIVRPLSKLQIDKAKPKEREYSLPDGQNLYLRIKTSGRKAWVFNYQKPVTKQRTNLTIGDYPAVEIIEARAKRDEYNALLAQGIDPQAEKQRIQEETESRSRDTFYSVAESYFNGIYQQKAKNPEIRKKNWARLEKHIFQHIGHLHVSEIKVKMLVEIYENFAEYSNTLKKLHQLIGAIMDHAVTKGVIDSHNCKLAIKNFYIKPSKPNPTIKIDELNDLFNDLNQANLSKQTYLLICWSFLTALRPNEAVNAQWNEINFDEKLWYIPKERMKGQEDKKRPHIVPLSSQALQLLEIMKIHSDSSPYIFRGRNSINQAMSNATVNTALKRNGYKDRLTAHGIRAFIKTFLASKKVDRNVSETILSLC